MRTNVAETSADAYDAIRREGQLSNMQARVMAAIESGRDYSLQEICRATGIPINAVSGRVNELKTAGRLQHGPRRPCGITGRTIHPVRLPAQQLEIAL